ncbi:MAG: hypothetical protein PVG78_11515 [Desulfobacterales bacterium]|jgi:hypothetical protein
MKKTAVTMTLVFAAGLLVSCQGGQQYHKTDMPDPAAFDARFDDLDKNGDGAVNWSEFKRSFPEASPDVFMELDLDDNAAVDPDEWRRFREAHGM